MKSILDESVFYRMDRCNALLSEHLLEVCVLSSRCWMRGRGCWRSCPGTEELSEWPRASFSSGDLLLLFLCRGSGGTPSTSRRCSTKSRRSLCCSAALPERRSWRVDVHSRAPLTSQGGEVTAGARGFDGVACEQQHCEKDTLDLQPKCQGNEKELTLSQSARKFC